MIIIHLKNVPVLFFNYDEGNNDVYITIEQKLHWGH